MLKLPYKKLSILVVIIFSLSFVYFYWLRDAHLNIYHAAYLDELAGGSVMSEQKTFIVEAPIFYPIKCTEIEQWVKTHQQELANDNIMVSNYEFLRYDDQISLKNPFLKSEYDAISLDYLVCRMNPQDQICRLCEK